MGEAASIGGWTERTGWATCPQITIQLWLRSTKRFRSGHHGKSSIESVGRASVCPRCTSARSVESPVSKRNDQWVITSGFGPKKSRQIALDLYTLKPSCTCVKIFAKQDVELSHNLEPLKSMGLSPFSRKIGEKLPFWVCLKIG